MEIKLSATRQEHGEESRLSRLEQVRAILEIAKVLESSLVALHDHKGELTATWAVQPTDEDKRAVELVWELLGEEAVVHETNEILA